MKKSKVVVQWNSLSAWALILISSALLNYLFDGPQELSLMCIAPAIGLLIAQCILSFLGYWSDDEKRN